jgi:hypothetical protein
MAYQVKKTEQRIRETLQIVDGTSGTSTDIPVDIYVDDVIKDYVRVTDQLKTVGTDPEKLGNAVIEMMGLVFGAAGAEKLLYMYQNRYMDMIGDIYPFIKDVVEPQLVRAMKDKTARYTSLLSR